MVFVAGAFLRGRDAFGEFGTRDAQMKHALNL